MANKYSQVIWDPQSQQWVTIGSSEFAEVLFGTTAQWNANKKLIATPRTIYVYTDYKIINKDNSSVYQPGIKIGDGTAYLIDMPFIGGDYSTLEQNLVDHINNTNIHVTKEEKDFWNDKTKIDMDVLEENLIFTI